MTRDENDRLFLDKIVRTLHGVGGVVGIVLGGSRARGTQTPDSDYDIGLYYRNGSPDSLDIEALSDAARQLDDAGGTDLIAPPGAWGDWVNGGGWLVVDGRRVDLLLRDIERVKLSIDDSHAGIVRPHYQTGHPHAFVNVMYAGELSIADILWDRDGSLRALRERTAPYPEALGKGVVAFFGFEAEFSSALAKTGVEKGDSYYAAAHIVRALSCLNQVLFAVNGEYCINEKGAVKMIDGFAKKPVRYRERVGETLSLLGGDAEGACKALAALVEETKVFAPE